MFDMIPKNGGWGGSDPVMLALQTLVCVLKEAGYRPADFEPGQSEVINLDIQIKVSPDGNGFALEFARANRWELIESDPDDIVGG